MLNIWILTALSGRRTFQEKGTNAWHGRYLLYPTFQRKVRTPSSFCLSFLLDCVLFVCLLCFSFCLSQHCYVSIWHVWEGTLVQKVITSIFLTINSCVSQFIVIDYFFTFFVLAQGIYFFQFNDPQRTGESHQKWLKRLTTHWCLKRGKTNVE